MNSKPLYKFSKYHLLRWKGIAPRQRLQPLEARGKATSNELKDISGLQNFFTEFLVYVVVKLFLKVISNGAHLYKNIRFMKESDTLYYLNSVFQTVTVDMASLANLVQISQMQQASSRYLSIYLKIYLSIHLSTYLNAKINEQSLYHFTVHSYSTLPQFHMLAGTFLRNTKNTLFMGE